MQKNKLSLEEIRNNHELREDYIKKRWLNLPDLIGKEVDNPFAGVTKEDLENPARYLLKIVTDIKYVYFTAKYIFNVTLSPLQVCLIQEIWNHPFPMLIGSRGMSKTFTLAFYVMLKAFISQGSKIVLTGAGFRQSKLLFEYAETIWSKADILRDICGTSGIRGMKSGPTRGIDKCEMVIGDSIITALPIGNGEKIRGLRATIIVADEFDAIDTEIFETVIRGFTVVSATPIENMQKQARLKALEELGYSTGKGDTDVGDLYKAKSNQIIISGTAHYSFRPFAKYWKRYKAIIMSRGDMKKLEELLEGEGESMENLDWKDFCVIRIPVDLIPEGYFDNKMISAAKATMHKSAYQMELGAVFVGDSDGFYKRSLVETCVTKHPIQTPSGAMVQFSATTTGQKAKKYVYGVDPAADSDNFALVILEVHHDHRRVVYCWTTTRKRYKDKQKVGFTDEHQFYGYCARKIRNLMKTFPCEVIAMDAQGGGRAVGEALSDISKIEQGEQPIWPVIDRDDPKDTDHNAGLHILKYIQQANAEWTNEANHGMKKDLEDKNLLFPRFDAVEVQLAGEADNKYELETGKAREDTLEDCILEIENLKEELGTIQHTITPAGRERWDTPEIKTPGSTKKGRLRKDRYSALLFANMEGRTLQRTPVKPEYVAYGGVVKTVRQAEDDKSAASKSLYSGPIWYTEKVGTGARFGVIVR